MDDIQIVFINSYWYSLAVEAVVLLVSVIVKYFLREILNCAVINNCLNQLRRSLIFDTKGEMVVSHGAFVEERVE